MEVGKLTAGKGGGSLGAGSVGGGGDGVDCSSDSMFIIVLFFILIHKLVFNDFFHK